jgi:DNA-binding LacI/PurR family transcriptional regulator
MRLLESPFDRESVYLVAQELRQYHEMRFTLAPLFKQAIEQPRISAWVCADDAIAAHAALPFLARRRARDIGVMAFNNSIEIAWQHGITSYDFGLSQLVVRMINTILDPRIAGQEKYIEPQGMVIERGSTENRIRSCFSSA